MGSQNPESPHCNGDEIIHWESYEPLHSLESRDWDYFLADMDVRVKLYDIEKKDIVEEGI